MQTNYETKHLKALLMVFKKKSNDRSNKTLRQVQRGNRTLDSRKCDSYPSEKYF